MISRREILEKMALVPFTFAIPKCIVVNRNHDDDLFNDVMLNQRTVQDSPELPYLELHHSGELKKRGEALWEIMKHCNLCPRGLNGSQKISQKILM
jgi:uncharacterized Fe-S radical SAM superfamily protein PflX